VVEVLQAISIALVVWYGSREILLHPEGDIQPGAIFSFILWVYMLYRPMRQLADRFNSLQMGIVSCERIFGLLDKQEQMMDGGNPNLSIQGGEIEFEGLNFSYVEGEPVLRNLNLKLPTGSTTAIVGSTGSGKTTLISLLSRMYEADSGSIRIDGQDIREFPLQQLQASIGIVLQDVFLFSDSIANNISLYNPEITRSQMLDAAKAVGAESLINSLPGGLDFNVRERGVNLSVGQRQLISFIRAYVYNPQILILDEATSSIDSETEQLIQEATEKLTRGRTSIVIAHRLSTVEHADRILVMHQGEIVEQGRHEELLSAKGRYWTLFQNQFSE
jgi:ATP-binding cassette subfamily B protein